MINVNNHEGVKTNFTYQVIEFKALNQLGCGLINRASVMGALIPLMNSLEG